MSIESLIKFWPLMYSMIREIWGITEPHIEAAADRNSIPIELYLYSEFGLDHFSIEEFRKRDPFTNPVQFEKVFARLDMQGWIEPGKDGRFRVGDNARQAVRQIIQAGDAQLSEFRSVPQGELERLKVLLKQIVTENRFTPPPPEKWAIDKRFRVATDQSPLIVQIRESLMDLYAYRDDSHLSAARPHFNDAGIVWMVLGALWKAEAVNAEQMAERMAFRGYEADEYEIALQASVEMGWVEPAERANAYRLTKTGWELRNVTEHLTNGYFYAPWSVLVQEEIDELYTLLIGLRDKLMVYRKSFSVTQNA
jgi:hypothetical protein